MSEITVYIYLEDRCISAEIGINGTLNDLRREFDEICEDDVALTRRRSKFSPTFSMIEEGEKREVKRKYKFKGAEKVYVGWSHLNLEDLQCNNGLQQTSELPTTSVSSQIQSDGDDATPITNETLNAEDDLHEFVETDLSQFGNNMMDDMNSLNDTIRIETLGPSPTSNDMVLPLSVPIYDSDEERCVDNPDSECDDSADTTKLSSGDESGTSDAENSNEKRPHKKRSEYRKPVKKIRKFDTTINKAKSLPNFSDMLKRNLRNNTFKMSHVLEGIREHIKQVTGDTYLKKGEMDVLCSSLIEEYPILADPDSNDKGFTVIRRSIQKSYSSHRYYYKNKEENKNKPSQSAKKITPLSRIQPSTSAISTEELTAELQSGFATDVTRMKWLIERTYKDRNNAFITSTNKLELIKLYPHLKVGRMMIYEYHLVIKNEETKLEDNCKKILQLLSTHYNLPQHTVDCSLEILSTVQDKLLPKQLQKQTLRKAITFKDATQVDRNTLCQLNTEQAPCIVSTVTTSKEGKRVLSTSVLLMHDEVINVLKDPTVPMVMQQLMAPYWVFDIKYPRAYESFLRLLERYIHGELSASTKRTRPKQEYTMLIRSLGEGSV